MQTERYCYHHKYRVPGIPNSGRPRVLSRHPSDGKKSLWVRTRAMGLISGLTTVATGNHEARRAVEDAHQVGHHGPHEREHQVEERDAAEKLARAAVALELLHVHLLLR